MVVCKLQFSCFLQKALEDSRYNVLYGNSGHFFNPNISTVRLPVLKIFDRQYEGEQSDGEKEWKMKQTGRAKNRQMECERYGI
jgi:hypothetical protein